MKINDTEMADAFVTAARFGHREVIGILLDYGISPDAKDQGGLSALVSAIRASHISIVELLLRHGCSLGNTRHGMPLTVAASMGSIPIAKLLLDFGAEVFSGSIYDESSAALVSLDEDIDNPRICLSPTPLYVACLRSDSAMVKLLLDDRERRGANPNLESPPTMIWMSFEDSEKSGLYRYFKGISKTADNTLGRRLRYLLKGTPEWITPLAAVLLSGNWEIAGLLLERRPKLPVTLSPKDGTGSEIFEDKGQ
jgi:hypothetical protein